MFRINHNTARVPRYQHEVKMNIFFVEIFCRHFYSTAGECLSSHEMKNRTRPNALEQRSKGDQLLKWRIS